VGDFNGDGIPDLGVGNSYDSTVSILLGLGDGSFRPAVTDPSAGSSAVAVGDFNGVGKLDLVTANCACVQSCAASVSILLGNGDGRFQAPITSVIGHEGASSLAVADFNGVGKADLAVIIGDTFTGATNVVTILLGNGNGTFQPPVTYPTGNGLDGTDGQFPYGGLVQATNGNFYGTALKGGASDYGTVFSIMSGGTLTTLLSFDSTDGAYPTAATDWLAESLRTVKRSEHLRKKLDRFNASLHAAFIFS